ncbi:hypothetical protein [Chitinophaga pinensis]|uniref:hypothetical protein n=1 Tax=Chitinophaga pinensis TaxID=79329 RepID=UPI001C992C00|nr:hypothetical protein [Chitinophaga pinensis]
MKSGHRKSEELATLFTDIIRQLVKDKEVSEESSTPSISACGQSYMDLSLSIL